MRLLGLKTFRHGVHPPESKEETSGRAIRQFPFAPLLIIPLAQHLGKPSLPVVRETQEVARGQKLARPDGFVSVRGPYSGGELITKPLKFSGKRLFINYSTSAGGGIRVELQEPGGEPIRGFALGDCPEIIGDRIEDMVSWKASADLSELAGKPLRLRFVLRDADLYAIQFREGQR